MPIQSQGIITKDNVSVDVSAVAYFRIKDPVRSVVAIENVNEAISQIAQTTLRAVVGRHTLDETLSETDKINQDIRAILDVQTEEWGVEVTVVELKDIQLPDTMKRAMARQAEAEREKRAKIIAAEGEALAAGELAHASDVMMAHPLALQLRNLQSLVEIGVDKNTTVVFPAPLMSTIQELDRLPQPRKRKCHGCPSDRSDPAQRRGRRARTDQHRLTTEEHTMTTRARFHAEKPILTTHPVNGGDALVFPIRPPPPRWWWLAMRNHAGADPVLIRPWDQQRENRIAVLCPSLDKVTEVMDAINAAVDETNNDYDRESRAAASHPNTSRSLRLNTTGTSATSAV